MTKALRTSLRVGLAIIIMIAGRLGASAQGNANSPQFVAGEMLISAAHNRPRADIDAAAAAVGARVVYTYQPILMAGTLRDVYQLRSTAQMTPAATTDAVQKLKQDARLVGAWPNKMYYAEQNAATSIPNDPRFSEQWDKMYMRMPEAWTLEKGKPNVVSVIIDTGVDIDHPEFPANRLFKPYNSVTQTTDPRPLPTNSHGTHVAGITIAQANNGVGIAGVVWEGCFLMPINASAVIGGFAGADLLRAYQYVDTQAAANTDKQFVVNLSLGSTATTDTPDPATLPPDEALLLNMANKGILFCMSAGNGFETGNAPHSPSYLSFLSKNIFNVAASNHLGGRAHYSQVRPTTTVAAPGGDDIAGKLILSTFPLAEGAYAEEQGTSMATPQVTGLISLLMSVPGVKPADIFGIVTSTARPPAGLPIPSSEFGYGIVDAYAALLKVAVSVTIIDPVGTGGKASGNSRPPDPIETSRPTFHFQISQIPPDKLTITVDGTTIPHCTSDAPTQDDVIDPSLIGVQPCYKVQNVTATITDKNNIAIPVTYQAVIHNLVLAPGQHTVVVVGVKPGNPDRVLTDTRTFTIAPHLIPAGRSMVSFPYYQIVADPASLPADRSIMPTDAINTITPFNYLGTDFRMARWIPELQRYKFFTSFGPQDVEASFRPPDTRVRQDGAVDTKYPLGLGYFIDLESAKPVITTGQPVADRPIIIPLRGNGTGDNRNISWNMIGDPFPFDVPFNALLLDTPEGRISIQEAVARGYILPNIYSYDAENGYTFRTLPDGALRAWQGHWVGITSRADVSLVVPPAKLSRASALPNAPRSVGKDGWVLRIGAHSRSLHDTYNFIGVSTGAADAYDRTDVMKPPAVGPYVSLAVDHSDWTTRAGLYAQDLRAPGATKTWQVQVTTDQANADVTVSWGGMTFPRNVRLVLKDETTGQTTDMRTRSAVTFNSGADAVVRKFTITAQPTTGTPLRITNVAVRTRAAGTNAIGFTLSSDATYDVKVLNAAGGQIGTIASRAAATGDVHVVWNGKDAGGKNVASGTYIVQIRASNPDGESVKVIYPFQVIR